MASVDIDTDGFEKAIAQLEVIEKSLKPRVSEVAMSETADLPEMIERSAASKGLVNETDTKPGQQDLTDSFQFNPVSGQEMYVYSTAPHAAAHQKGTKSGSKYPIPDDGSGVLFFPENPGEYFEPYRNPDGSVTIPGGVMHPGVEKTPYITEPVSIFRNKLVRAMNAEIKDTIIQAGFRWAGADLVM